MSTKKISVIIFSMALLILFSWYFLYRNNVPEDSSVKSQEQVSQTRTNQQNSFLKIPGTESSNSSIQNTTKSKSQMIDELTATGDPKDALLAFRIAQDCVWLRIYNKQSKSRDTNNDDEEELKRCDEITPIQIKNRINNLNKALEAKIRGAVSAFVSYGPIDGEPDAIYTRPDDPIVIEWEKKVEDLTFSSALSGDTESLAALVDNYLSIKDFTSALTYEIAQYEILNFENDPEYDPLKKMISETTAFISKNMTTDQINLATARGKQIALNCCSKK